MCVVCKWLTCVVANVLRVWFQMAYARGCNWLMFFAFCCIFLHNFAYEITLLIIMLCWTDHNFGGVLCVDGFIVLDVSI